MSEMIYGNTGRRDEGINIDMETALYQKLQSRTFVPKLKSLLSDKHPEGDKSFVFIGEFADKAGKFTIYGYNAKLENDSRGGDYGHYVAVPMDNKAVSADMAGTGFLSEEGFVEYVNLKTLNNEKRFSVSSVPVTIEENAKKRIVNNLMETFMKVRKRKNVTVSFADCALSEFNSKSLFVLMEIMKYLPLRMRKNVSFISHVMSNQKLPDMINLAVYPEDCEFKAHDCISLDDASPLASDAVFAGYVEKVFEMTDSEREAYFEKLHNDIECPADAKGVDVKSGLYLIDISTKQLWQSGESKEAVSNIFASVEDILRVYDEYKQIAKVRLEAEKEAVMEYVKESVKAAANTDDLKTVYVAVAAVFELCQFGDHFLSFENDVRIHFTMRANEIIATALTDDTLVKILSGIVSIDEAVLDKAYTLSAIKEHMAKKTDTNAIHVLYLKLKEKKFVDPHELNLSLEDAVNELISRVTGRYAEAKDRLAALERMYGEFKSTTSVKDYPMIDEIYSKYRDKFTGNASEEAKRKAIDIIATVDREVERLNAYYNLKDYLKELSKAEVRGELSLKRDASRVYARVAGRLFAVVQEESFDYASATSLISDIASAVKTINSNGVYEGMLTDASFDPLYKFTSAMETLINKLERSYSLTEALLACEEAAAMVNDRDSSSVTVEAYTKFASLVFHRWLDRNSKYATMASFKKSEKELSKLHGKQTSLVTRKLFNEYPGVNNGKGGSSPAKLIIMGVAALVVIAGLVVGGICLFGGDEDKKAPVVKQEETKYTISEDAVKEVEDYLASFKDGENAEPAVFVYAEVNVVEGTETEPTPSATNPQEPSANGVGNTNPKQKGKTEKVNVLKIYEDFGYGVKEASVEYNPVKDKSKMFFDLESAKKGEKFIVAVQKTSEENTVIARDIFKFGGEIEKGYNFDAEYLVDKKNNAFCQNVIRYIGFKNNFVDIEKEVAKEKRKAKTTITKEEKEEIEKYLKGFITQENENEAEIALAKFTAKEGGYVAKIEKALGSQYTGTVDAQFSPTDGCSKSFFAETDLKADSLYVAVFQLGVDGTTKRIRDVFIVPGGTMDGYDFDAEYTQSENGAQFCQKLLKYAGYKDGLVELAEKTEPPKGGNQQ